MQDAAKTQGLAVADWAEQVLKAAVSTISFASEVQPTHNIRPVATSRLPTRSSDGEYVGF